MSTQINTYQLLVLASKLSTGIGLQLQYSTPTQSSFARRAFIPSTCSVSQVHAMDGAFGSRCSIALRHLHPEVTLEKFVCFESLSVSYFEYENTLSLSPTVRILKSRSRFPL